MSHLTPPRRTWSSGIVVALLIALPLAAIPQTARADIGDEPSSGTKPSGDSVGQADDTDKPKDPSLLDKNAADAAAAKKASAPVGPPFYEKWQFWAIAGVVVIGVIGLVWAGQQIAHQASGGDVRPCNEMFTACFGGN